MENNKDAPAAKPMRVISLSLKSGIRKMLVAARKKIKGTTNASAAFNRIRMRAIVAPRMMQNKTKKKAKNTYSIYSPPPYHSTCILKTKPKA